MKIKTDLFIRVTEQWICKHTAEDKIIFSHVFQWFQILFSKSWFTSPYVIDPLQPGPLHITPPDYFFYSFLYNNFKYLVHFEPSFTHPPYGQAYGWGCCVLQSPHLVIFYFPKKQMMPLFFFLFDKNIMRHLFLFISSIKMLICWFWHVKKNE